MSKEELKEDVDRGSQYPLNIYQDPDYVQRMDVAKQNAFRGDYPFEDILEELSNQFSNYIQLDASDRTNYVSIFFHQLKNSMQDITEEDGDLMDEQMEYLDIIYNHFIDTISELFQRRLSISLNFLETNPYHPDTYEILDTLYEFFILNARNNFKQYFTQKSLIAMKRQKPKNEEVVTTIYHILDDMDHSLAMDCMVDEFIQLTANKPMANTINDYFEENMISGNFLTRYSARFYQNTDLFADIADDVISMYMYQKEKEHG